MPTRRTEGPPHPPGSGRRDPTLRSPTGTTVHPEIMRGMKGQPRELVGLARAPVLCHGRPAEKPFLRVSLAGESTQASRHRFDGSLRRTHTYRSIAFPSSGCTLVDPETRSRALHGFYTMRTVVTNQAGISPPTS